MMFVRCNCRLSDREFAVPRRKGAYDSEPTPLMKKKLDIVLKMHNAGLNGRQIAERVGRTESWVSDCRKFRYFKERVRLRNVWTPKLLEKLKDLRESGATKDEILEVIGCTLGQLHYAIKKYNLPRSPNSKPASDDEIFRIIELREMKFTEAEIGEMVGFHRNTIHRILKVHGCMLPEYNCRFIDLETRAKIRAMYQIRKKTRNYIAKEFGISHESVNRIVKEPVSESDIELEVRDLYQEYERILSNDKENA